MPDLIREYSGAFPPEGAVRFGSVCKGSAIPDRVSGGVLCLAVLLRWGTETPEWVPASSIYTRRPLIGRQNRTSVLQGDNKKETHYPRGTSGQRRKLC